MIIRIALVAQLSEHAIVASAQTLSTARGQGPFSALSRQWRVVNLETVTYGWSLGELRFFSDPACGLSFVDTVDSRRLQVGSSTAEPSNTQSVTTSEALLTYEFIASGHRDHAPESRAFDGQTWSDWRAQCYLCEPREAWLGLSFSEPVGVFCVQIWQIGRREHRSSSVALQRWEEITDEWEDVLEGSGLDGGRWDTVRFVICDSLQEPVRGRLQLTNGGFYPSSASFECSGVNFLLGPSTLTCNDDGQWSGSPPKCWAPLEVSIIVASVVCAEVFLCLAYYYCYIARKAPALTTDSFIHEDHRGSWAREEFVTDRLLCCLAWPCRIAETWHSAGQVPFAAGVFLAQCLPGLPCLGAILRHRIRERLNIKGTRCKDFFAWSVSLPLAAVQEAETIDRVCAMVHEESRKQLRKEEKKAESEKAQQARAKERAENERERVHSAQDLRRSATAKPGINKQKSVIAFGGNSSFSV